MSTATDDRNELRDEEIEWQKGYLTEEEDGWWKTRGRNKRSRKEQGTNMASTTRAPAFSRPFVYHYKQAISFYVRS
jgi:hypothetical protein